MDENALIAFAQQASALSPQASTPTSATLIDITSPSTVSGEYDWSGTGRGKHVDFANEETLSLTFGRSLGRRVTSEVNESTCQGATVAVKRRSVCHLHSTISSLSSLKGEMTQLDKLDHLHIAKTVGSFAHGCVFGIIYSTVAICDLGVFLDDLDDVQTELLKGRRIDRRLILKKVGEEGIARLKALNALTITRTDGAYFYGIDPGLERVRQSLGCLASALAYIHGERIEHRNLKPSNVVLTESSLFLTDFATSVDIEDMKAGAKDPKRRVECRYQALGVTEELSDKRSADVFSMGCIFLEILYVGIQEWLRDVRFPLQRENAFKTKIDEVLEWLKYNTIPRYPGRFDKIGCLIRIVKDMMTKEPWRRPTAARVDSRMREYALMFLDKDCTYRIRFSNRCC